MNKFDTFFFQKYLPSGVKMKHIIHQHIIMILGKIFLNYFFYVLIPTFLYYTSDFVKQTIPFYFLEIFMILMFIKILYDVLNWYTDVWIVTNEGVIELDWSLLSVNSVSVKYDSVEGIEIVQDGFFDTLFSKGKLVIHKVGGGGDNFILENAALPYDAIDEIETISREQRPEDDDEEEYDEHHHFDKGQYNMLIEALSGVVEQYMENSGYKKDDTKEKADVIDKVKRKKGTLDMR